MPQTQQNIPLLAPGFAGLNTEDSPLNMDPQFCSEAQNCVIDKFGRISSRKGIKNYTENPTTLSDNPIVSTEQFVLEDGTEYLFATGNNEIYLQDTSSPFELTALTLPALYTITADNWKIVPFNDKCYFVQASHQPLVFDPAVSTTALDTWADEPSTVATDGYPDVAHAAYGRLWLSNFDNNGTILYWSGLLNGEEWTVDGTGSLFTAEYWPSGFDTVSAITAHNNFLVVFGTRNILLYNTTADVANDLALADTIENIGCIARDTVESTGTDVMFLDSSGVRSLNRTIQEKSVPVGDASRNVRTDIQFFLNLETNLGLIKSVYDAEEAFYVIFFPSSRFAYVLDTRQLLPDGSSRVTTWNNIDIQCGVRLRDRAVLFGGLKGLYTYEGSDDEEITAGEVVTTPVEFVWSTHYLVINSSVNLIFPKQVDATFVGGNAGNITLRWAYNYLEFDSRLKIEKQIGDASVPAFWGDAEWDDGSEYTLSFSPINELTFNVWGNGRNIKIGFRGDVSGTPLSIQELNIQALQGRTI